jgi:cell division protein FtsN
MNQQRGGTLVGFVIGLVVGLAVALGVAVYITKVPIPFMNKAANRGADQDAVEEQKNKDWDPNAPLYGKKAVKADAEAKPEPSASGKTDAKPDKAVAIDPKSADPIGDLAKVKSTENKATENKAAEAKPAASAEAKSDAFFYFVQAGAYRSTEEAEAQRAKLGLLGLDAKISERDQGGRTVYRVRVGPINDKAEAERVRGKLDEAHLDSAMVRVQR